MMHIIWKVKSIKSVEWQCISKLFEFFPSANCSPKPRFHTRRKWPFRPLWSWQWKLFWLQFETCTAINHVPYLCQGSRNYSIHPLGVFYDKGNEGAVYRDGTSGNDTADDAIMPNQTFLYRWTVPEAVAPTEKDAPCITWMYHSNVETTKDIESGKNCPYSAMLSGSNGTSRLSLTLESGSYQRSFGARLLSRFNQSHGPVSKWLSKRPIPK